jgi:hypothetical protein
MPPVIAHIGPVTRKHHPVDFCKQPVALNTAQDADIPLALPSSAFQQIRKGTMRTSTESDP